MRGSRSEYLPRRACLWSIAGFLLGSASGLFANNGGDDNPCLDPGTKSDPWVWEGKPNCEYAKYTVEITAPDADEVFEKDSGETATAKAEREGEDSGTTDESADITWEDDASGSGATSDDFTDSTGKKKLTADLDGETEEVEVYVVELEIKGPDSTQDGASASFEIEIEPEDLDLTPTYEWSYTTPGGAGNLPDGDIFDDKTKIDPEVSNAWWFASPDSKSSAAIECNYTIEVEIDFGDSQITKTKDWEVFITSHPDGYLGETPPPFITGLPEIVEYNDPRNEKYKLYKVGSGNGALDRNSPTNGSITYHVLDSSQWKSKTKKHEEYHVMQWTTGGWKDYYSLAKLRNQLSKIDNNYSSRDALVTKIKNIILEFNRDERARSKITFPQREQAAREHASDVAPYYYDSYP